MAYPVKDLSLQFFGRLFAIEPSGKDKHNRTIWWCHCECGNFTEVAGFHLTSGHTKSCGCLLGDIIKVNQTIHGDGNNQNAPYKSWKAMLRRCENPKHASYRWYGAKGISVCDDWHDYAKFKQWALTNGWEKGLTIDRIDVSKGYFPENCRWVTQSENAKHQQDK